MFNFSFFVSSFHRALSRRYYAQRQYGSELLERIARTVDRRQSLRVDDIDPFDDDLKVQAPGEEEEDEHEDALSDEQERVLLHLDQLQHEAGSAEDPEDPDDDEGPLADEEEKKEARAQRRRLAANVRSRFSDFAGWDSVDDSELDLMTASDEEEDDDDDDEYVVADNSE
jgi:hypothetical protein